MHLVKISEDRIYDLDTTVVYVLSRKNEPDNEVPHDVVEFFPIDDVYSMARIDSFDYNTAITVDTQAEFAAKCEQSGKVNMRFWQYISGLCRQDFTRDESADDALLFGNGRLGSTSPRIHPRLGYDKGTGKFDADENE